MTEFEVKESKEISYIVTKAVMKNLTEKECPNCKKRLKSQKNCGNNKEDIMNKEIQEIAKIVIKELDQSTDGTFYTEEIATALYNAGYRKQSDTIREFAEKAFCMGWAF